MFIYLGYNNKNNLIKGTNMKNAQKNNTIDLTKVSFSNIDEIDGVIKTLSVYDLIDACNAIREIGVVIYDYDKDDEITLPLDMDKIHKATETPEWESLESLCRGWFSSLLAGEKNTRGYKDFVYWYNANKEIFEHDVAEGNNPTISYCDIKYLALKDTINCMCEVLMTA